MRFFVNPLRRHWAALSALDARMALGHKGLAEVQIVNRLVLPLSVWLAAGVLCADAGAQILATRSVSGQFVARQKQGPMASPAAAGAVRTPLAGGWAFLLSSKPVWTAAGADMVTLEPSLLVVSCERLKTLLLFELRLEDRWRGKIDLTINPALPADRGPLLTGICRPDGWCYELELPRTLKREVLVRAVIQTLLLEMANRQAGPRSADIPLWLVEGLSARLEANNLPIFILQPGQHWQGDMVWRNSSEMLPEQLRHHPALTFQQLSWPQTADLADAGLPLYRVCAQLFLEELLRLDDGRACLCSMLAQLARHWNWQTAFLQAFHSHFEQLLDVEKWWGLSYVQFTSEYAAQPWSAADSWKKLKDSLDVPVDVHLDTNQMPVEARLTLQEVIRQWAPADAVPAIQRAIGGLRFLAPRATPELRPLVRLYLKTLQDYLHDRQVIAGHSTLGKHDSESQRLHNLKADAITQLDALDRMREGLRPVAADSSSDASQFSKLEDPDAKAPPAR